MTLGNGKGDSVMEWKKRHHGMRRHGVKWDGRWGVKGIRMGDKRGSKGV